MLAACRALCVLAAAWPVLGFKLAHTCAGPALRNDTKFTDTSVERVLGAGALNLFLFVSVILGVACLDRSPRAHRALAPKHAEPHKSLLATIQEAIFASTDDVSLDGRIVIRFCTMGAKFCAIGTAFTCVLIPLYASGRGHAHGLMAWTVLNLDRRDMFQFRVMVLACLIMAVVFVWLIVDSWRDFIEMRRIHFWQRARGLLGPGAAQAQFSLMVERIPKNSRSSEGLANFFGHLFSGVHSATIHMNRNPFGLSGYSGPSSTGFVTLANCRDRLVSEEVVLFASRGFSRNFDLDDWHVRAAPEARDIIWENLQVPQRVVIGLSAMASCGCIMGLVLWSVPVAGIQTIASQSNIEYIFPDVVEFANLQPTLYGMAMGYLPVLALMFLISLLPSILKVIAWRLERRKTWSDVTRVTLLRNFGFQLATFWITTFAGSMFDLTWATLNRPLCLGPILAHALPQASVYFITFVIARIGTTLPMLLIPVGAMLNMVRGGEPKLVYCKFEVELVNLAIVFVMAMTYCIIAPLIMPVCLVYFVLASCVYRHSFRHYYDVRFDSCGAYWYELHAFLNLGLLSGSLVVLGLALGASDGVSPMLCATFLVPVAVVAFFVYCELHFKPLMAAMTYQDAREVDRESTGAVLASFDAGYYLDPCADREASRDSEDCEDCDDDDETSDGEGCLRPWARR